MQLSHANDLPEEKIAQGATASSNESDDKADEPLAAAAPAARPTPARRLPSSVVARGWRSGRPAAYNNPPQSSNRHKRTRDEVLASSEDSPSENPWRYRLRRNPAALSPAGLAWGFWREPAIDPALPAAARGASRTGIPNLGATCYLNSFFKYATYHGEFGKLVSTPLERQAGESERLFAARHALQQSLQRILRFLSTSGEEQTAPEALPVPYVRNFIASWNRMYMAELASEHKVTGVQFLLEAGRQEDSAYVARVVLNALAYPPLRVTETLSAVDSLTRQPLAELPARLYDRVLPGTVDLTLNSYDRTTQISMQALVDRVFGPEADDYVSDVRTWLDQGESTSRHLAQKAMYLAEGTPALSFIINDRIYPDYNAEGPNGGFRNRKNETRLMVEPEVRIATLRPDGTHGQQRMRLRTVIVHAGGAYGGHYKMVSYESDGEGKPYWVTHDDAHLRLGADMQGLQRGARLLHYERVTGDD